MSETDLLLVTPEERKKILEIFEKDENILAEDVKIIRDWILTQPHFPETPSNKAIENFFLNNKCSFERTKEKLDMYYSIRTIIPELYENTNPKLPHMKDIMKACFFIPMPSLTDNLERMAVCKLNPKINFSEKFDAYHYFAMTLNKTDVRLEEDTACPSILIYDCTGISLSLIKKFTPIHVKKISVVTERVFSNQINALHYVNISSFMDGFFTIVKQMLNPKLAKRIHIHKSPEALLKIYSKRILPKNYGGDQKTLEELSELWEKKLEEYQERFDKLDSLKVDESLRPKKLINDEILGFHGNFKKLNVD